MVGIADSAMAPNTHQREAYDKGKNPYGGNNILGPLGCHQTAITHRLGHSQISIHGDGTQVEDLERERERRKGRACTSVKARRRGDEGALTACGAHPHIDGQPRRRWHKLDGIVFNYAYQSIPPLAPDFAKKPCI